MKSQGSNEIMGKKLTHWTKDQKTEAAIHYAINEKATEAILDMYAKYGQSTSERLQ